MSERGHENWQPPETIYLQPCEAPEVTWCADDIGPCETCGRENVRYVRADTEGGVPEGASETNVERVARHMSECIENADDLKEHLRDVYVLATRRWLERLRAAIEHDRREGVPSLSRQQEIEVWRRVERRAGRYTLPTDAPDSGKGEAP